MVIHSFKEVRPYKHGSLATIVEVEFWHGDENLWGQQESESQAFENVLAGIVSDYEVDFTTFK
jgi:hypothetical protein